MSYKVKLSPKADKFLNKLDKKLSEHIEDRLRMLRNNPFLHLQRFQGDCYKFRCGDYRALIDVDQENKLVIVRVVGHRRNIYK